MRKLLLTLLVLAGCGGGGDSWTTQAPVTGSPGDQTASTNPLPPTATCQATLTWEPPYDRVDGTPITTEELKKYTIYVSHQESTKDTAIIVVIDITDTNLITYEVDGLSKGQKYFYMTATDTEGYESSFSNILNKLC